MLVLLTDAELGSGLLTPPVVVVVACTGTLAVLLRPAEGTGTICDVDGVGSRTDVGATPPGGITPPPGLSPLVAAASPPGRPCGSGGGGDKRFGTGIDAARGTADVVLAVVVDDDTIPAFGGAAFLRILFFADEKQI